MKRLSHALFFAAGVALSRQGVASALPAVSVQPDTSCTVTPTDTQEPWKLVTEAQFTFCVPSTWESSGRRGWRGALATGGKGSFTWSVGRAQMKVPFRVGRVTRDNMPEPSFDPPQQFSEPVDGHIVVFTDGRFQARYVSTATWGKQEIQFSGDAATRAMGDVLFRIYRTVRITPP